MLDTQKIRAIRVLPLSEDRFAGKTIADYQAEMDYDEIGYRSMIHTPEDTLLLYRSRNTFFAYAMLESIVKNGNSEYPITIKIKPDSYTIFSPISNKKFVEISSDFKKHPRATAIIDLACKNEILSVIERMRFIQAIETELSDTEYEQVIKSRIGQSAFRERLIGKYCGGMICRLRQRELLYASHIKPWRDSNNKERLDMLV